MRNQPIRSHHARLARAVAAGSRSAAVVENLERRLQMSAVTFTVAGSVRWTDSAGGTHALPGTVVQIFDQDAGGARTLIATATTNATGNYTKTVTYDDGAGQGNPDVVVRALSRSAAAVVHGPDTSAPYALTSAVRNEVVAGATANFPVLVAGNGTVAGQSFGVSHALFYINGYTAGLTGEPQPSLDVTIPGSGSFFSAGPPPSAELFAGDSFDWDVIFHEYGHYIQNKYGFEDNPGGDHSSADNLSIEHGKEDGLKLAWGEGFATYFGVSAALGAAPLGIPNVGDVLYNDTVDQDLVSNQETGIAPAGGGKTLGEDNEFSVSVALWDVFDSANEAGDGLTLGDQKLFDLLRAKKPVTVGEAFDDIAATLNNAGKAALGSIYGKANIAPVQTGPADGFTPVAGSPPTFTWQKKGAGEAYHNNQFRLKFYSPDFATVVYQSPALGDVSSFKPSAAAWAQILAAGPGVKWVVEGRNTASPTSPGGAIGYYWSAARSIGTTVTPPAGGLTKLVLVDADADADIADLSNGSTIKWEDLPTLNLSVRAVAGGAAVKSVRFTLDGKPVRTENGAPYSLFGDVSGDFNPGNIPTGTHTLVATPYAGTGGTGAAGTPLSVTFTYAGRGRVTQLVLVDADTDKDVMTLTEGATLNLSALPDHLNVRAVTAGGAVGSVRFALDGGFVRTENAGPFSLFGDVSGNYVWGTFATGNRTLKVTPFSQDDLGGLAGGALTIKFKVTAPATARPAAGTAGFAGWSALGEAPAELLTGHVVDGLFKLDAKDAAAIVKS